FVRRRVGPEVAEVLADALVTGIHAGDPTLLSVRAAFPRLAALEEQYGSVLKGLARTARQRRAPAAAPVVVAGSPVGARSPDPAPTGGRTGKMWAFREGLRLLIETLCAGLPSKPLLGIAVQRIQRATGMDSLAPPWTVCGEGNDRWPADVVVLTCPA